MEKIYTISSFLINVLFIKYYRKMDKEILKAFGFKIDKNGNAVIDMPFISVPDGIEKNIKIKLKTNNGLTK